MKVPAGTPASPGPIILFGSGETSASGRKVFDAVLQDLRPSPNVALLETPAGFELNSAQVIARVAEFLEHRLQNYKPQITIVPARKRGTDHSPDDPDISAPLLQADLIFMGPGSPSYAVRQLKDSIAWYNTLARHRLGAAIALASAAVIAVSNQALPIYEIYKVGEDLHWKPGLDLFGYYGLQLVFVPHWNNNEGGSYLDTSRCFMGQPRFERMMELLPGQMTVVGIDEHTALIMDPAQACCHVVGRGGVTIIHTGPVHSDATTSQDLVDAGLDKVVRIRSGHIHQFQSGESFELKRIGMFKQANFEEILPREIWQQAQSLAVAQPSVVEIPDEVSDLVKSRQAARASKDWEKADVLREQVQALGWQVLDTPYGSEVTPL